jgi:transposase-like protein/ribosomal protein L37AE/L43A
MQQESIDLIEFMKRFQTEEQCAELLFKFRWPDGFICPKCGHVSFYRLKRRGLYGCSKCDHQISATANTIFHGSHIPLTKWFTAIFMAAHDKRGVSSVKLSRDISVSQPTAWLMLHKIRSAMADQDSSYMLSRIVEIDDAYFGAPAEGGKRGRGTDKTPGVIALQVDDKGRPEFIKLSVVENLQGETLAGAIQGMVEAGSEVRTDGLSPYSKLSERRYDLKQINFDIGEAPEHLLWLHKVISNLKAFIAGTFHGLDKKHLQRYFDEFAYRFNRRKYGPQLFMRLVKACVSTETITYKQLVCKHDAT